MIALLQDEETQLTNEIKTKAEDHEIDLDTLTGDYEKKILIVDKKYEALEKEISDIKDEFNKWMLLMYERVLNNRIINGLYSRKEQIAVAIHEKEIQDLNDKFIKDLKIKEENGRKVCNISIYVMYTMDIFSWNHIDSSKRIWSTKRSGLV